jgi:hypothetical protein
MLSIMEGAGQDILRLRNCQGTKTVSLAYKNFCAFRVSQALAIAQSPPPKEKAEEKDDASEKEEATTGGRYGFMLCTYFVEVINIVFG